MMITDSYFKKLHTFMRMRGKELANDSNYYHLKKQLLNDSDDYFIKNAIGIREEREFKKSLSMLEDIRMIDGEVIGRYSRALKQSFIDGLRIQEALNLK